MKEPIDTIFQYTDGEHIDTQHIQRAKQKQMTKEEDAAFFYHLSECPDCAKLFLDYIYPPGK